MLFLTRWKRGHLLCNLRSSSQARHFSHLSQGQAAENLWCLWSGSNSVPQCANPTSASRGYSITAVVSYILSMNHQLPSLSVVSCIWSLSIAGFCRFLVTNSRTFPAPRNLVSHHTWAYGKEFSHPCMFTRSQVLFFLADQKN